MKICFNARHTYDRFSSELYLTLLRNCDPNLDACFVTLDYTETKYISECIFGAEIFEIAGFIEQNKSGCTLEKLCAYEKKFDCAPIWSYIYTDRFLISRPYNTVVAITVGLFMLYDKIFKDGRIDFYYDEAIATLPSYVAYIVGKHYGVKYITQATARGRDKTHHFFSEDPFQTNADFNLNYKSITYTQEEKQQADEFLTAFEASNARPASLNVNGQTPRFRAKFFVIPAYYLLHRFDRKYSNPYAYMYFKNYKRLLNPIHFYFRYQASKKFYNKADLSKKYVLYTLHYQPEASTCVRAQKYEKQLFFIDSLAKSLSADMVLYVKEHYANLGHRPIRFYKELKQLPNVVLIDPLENTRDLILHAQAVTTLTGTAGWEAMLLRKPVIVGGKVYYSNAPGVMPVDDIYGQSTSLLNSWTEPSRDDVIQYLCEYMRSLSPGLAYFSDGKIYEPNNMKMLAKSAYHHMDKRLRAKAIKGLTT